jgi:hypothetical protein
MPDLPYADSKAGQSREGEIRATMRGVGATAIGFMVDDDAQQVICQFRLQGREYTVPVSISAYRDAWLKAVPCGPRTEAKVHRARAQAQAERAVWAILADWIKAQAAMITCGSMTPEEAMLGHVHAPGGQRMIEVVTAQKHNLLPAPEKS